MLATTKPAAHALTWQDAHAIDPATWPAPSTSTSGRYVTALSGVLVSMDSHGAGAASEPGRVSWIVSAEGPAAVLCDPTRHDSLDGARAFVSRMAGRVASGAAFGEAWAAEAAAHRVGACVSGALDSVADLESRVLWPDDSPRHLLGYARALELFAAELARRGFAFGPDGKVRETWRDRARGRWVDLYAIIRPEESQPVETSGHVVRVEGAHVLEVLTDGGDEWTVEVDGEQRATVRGREQALRFALREVEATSGRGARTA